ncbi:MAG: FKBP-type peptidyl-prolyl cis-trans isomerase [Rikenellaceae bacterium]|nr:FKBP-type peptidyl-prolyl cis-trans isomerase [Rikenellaceae bacterium]
MKIGEKTFVALSYELTVDGQQVEKVTADAPLQFVYGAGFLLPKFEEQLAGLSAGDTFAFRLEPADAYGGLIEEAVVELPKSVFMIDGKIEDGLLEVGNQLPMSDNQGNRLVGTVKAVGDESVTMDFNHPMAGKALQFTGAVVNVREATPEDMMQGQMAAGGGCSCCGGEEGECGEHGCGSDKGSCGCH